MKSWGPLIPPYDPDLLENDLLAEEEFKNSKFNFKFNKHGFGFDQYGNEVKYGENFKEQTSFSFDAEIKQIKPHSRDEL